MVRYVVYMMEWGAGSAMSAELTHAADELSGGGKCLVQVVGVTSAPDGLVTVFEVMEPDDDDDDDDDGTTPGAAPGRSH
jgi:hypothetical protein